MKIENLTQAEEMMAIYCRLISEAEQIEEAMKEYVTAHEDVFPKPRLFAKGANGDSVPGVTVGFRKVQSSVVIESEEDALPWLKKRNTMFVETIERVDRPALKKFLARGADGNLEDFAARQIFYRGPTRAFMLKLEREREER